MKKGKKIIVILLVLCLAVALLLGGIAMFAGNTPAPAAVVAENVDIDWYDENGKEFLLTTVEELYGLAELSKTHDFKGQTIKLGADIVINEGDAKTWADKAPEYLWNPITGFAGTFDGQGHTISGVYGNSIVTSLGLFTDTQKSCVIKNLNLVNSCFKNNNDMGTGSIIGVGGGKLENIYSDAVMISSGKYVGGLIGSVKTKGENQITNCWFDGTITMDGYDCANVGGLVGSYNVEDAINTIEHSLSTADISCMGENVGGICGSVGNGAFLNLNDSMFTGTLEYDTNKYAVVGSVIGQVMGSASTIINDTYTVDEIANRTIGTNSGYQKGSAIAVGKDYLMGQGGYQWTTLDFDNYWVVQKEGMPRLGYYTQATESLDGVQKMVDISWYDQAGAAFEITNVQQLYGFAYLSRSYDFRGQTIKLGADITVNEGNAADWAENAPAYNWTPIAWYGSSLSQRFKGTFDGQGHTVSGIYCKGTENITSLGFFGEVYHGAVVKDFKLVNSYFEGVLSADVRGPVGSVAGRLRGTIEDVYSDAIVVNSSKNTGGIVGMITGTGQNKISGCWFNGTLYGITRSGGILGGVYGNKGNIEATIEHCLNTGVMRIEKGQAGVGGICGTAETWSILYVDDCLNAGFYGVVGTDKKSSTHIGTLVGTVTQTDGVGSKAVITDSYGVPDFYSRLVGWEYDDEGVVQSSVMYVERDELIGYGGYKWTSLDFDNHWSIRGNACPVPVKFAPRKLSTAGLVRMVDYSWYDPNETVHTIWNFQQLYGMARMWEVTNQFKDQTVKLGMDIVLNEGDASQWGEKAPEYEWVPARFNGTFDGQGHTISGIYVKGGEEDNYVGLFYRIYQNGTVKNLKLTNSYIEGTMAANVRGATGSIAGRSNGVIDTVYSDAIVVNSARMTGGLVGMITGEGTNTIRNSWFDGEVTGVTRTGGILGGVYGNKQDIEVTIDTCVNTGDIAVSIGSGDVGGICGMAETGGTLYITDSLNAGTYKTVGEGKEPNTHIGTVFGSVTQSNDVASHVVLDNVYGVEEFYNKLVGWKYAAEGVTQSVGVLMDMETLTADGGYRYTDLDFEKAYGLNGENVPVPKAFATKKPDAAVLANQLDYSWYDPAATEYTITTASQLEAFNVLCNAENNYFKGKTVKLGADITLNEGNASDWATTAPENVWTPVTLNGTFDGQGHTISGVYVNSTKQYTGFFGTMNSGSFVKDLKLVNSYIEGNGTETRSGVGSIAGRNLGTIDTVYSEAILKNSKQMTGGIVGMSTGATENTITNCWFNGQINAVGSTGGILGGTYAATATVEHCLNTGTITVEAGTAIGGLCGYAQSTGGVTIRDSLNAGTIVKGNGTIRQVGTVIGAVHANATETTAENAYGVTEFSASLYGYGSATHEDGSVSAVRNLADIKGYGAYQWTTLDFDGGTWVLKNEKVPALAAFDKTDLSLEEAKELPDYSWYDESSDVYVITTAQQLLGFNQLCNNNPNSFKEKTIKLGANITLNEGNAADWAEKAPETVWNAIKFYGAFDGQGHTVSGVYVNATATGSDHTGFFGVVYGGATVKNLKLINSYIEGNGTATRSAVGSIAGLNNGTIDTVYSNAVVVNNKQMTGGIVGMSGADTKITNCWFDGQINAVGSTGGILGGTYAAAATVEHCLNTGHITIETKGASLTAIGGLCGYAQSSGGITIQDSLNAGEVTLTANGSDTIKQVGSIIGAIHVNATQTKINDTYGIANFSADTIGYGKVAAGSGNYAVRKLADIKGYGAYQWTTLDFDNGKWVLKKDATPVLGAFDTTDLILDFAKTLPDYSWYDETADTYVITTAGQLLGFNELCNEEHEYFAGKTVKLSASITLTGGSETTPNWTPVDFSGTFDGQGNTISGLYVYSTGWHTGFFSTLNSGATVMNLKLTDSYIEGNYAGTESRAGVGSIAGRNHGTIDTVYSTAIVKNSKLMTGGIAGFVDAGETGTITNCWFGGKIDAGSYTGGILGGTYKATAKVEHCLNTGVLTITWAGTEVPIIGGLIGNVHQTGSEATVTDSLNAGTFTKVGSYSESKLGTLVGVVHGNATLTINNAYGVAEFDGKTFGYTKNNVTGSNYAAVSVEKIKGYNAYYATTLGFESGTWVLMNDIPCLAAFAEGELTVADAKSQPDYNWYDENATEYVISTVAQMRGYVELCAEGVDFTGKTITLGADTFELSSAEQLRAFAAVCAKNDFAGKTVKLTENIDLSSSEWTPVDFGGTFDGNGKTISGLTVSLFNKLDGATVKNLKLTNSVAAEATNSTISYCVLTNAEASILGIAKDGTTLEHCYSDGGLIADVQGTTVVKDSLAAGKPVTTATDGELTMTDVYGIGTTNGSATVGSAAYTVRNRADLQGYGAYQWTTLDFDGGTWVLKDGAIPALGAFDTTDLDLNHAKTLPDYNWYDENADAYIISNAAQMRGYVEKSKETGFTKKTITLGRDTYVLSSADDLLAFNSLCTTDTDYFKGKTIALGADITLTGGTAAAPNWTPQNFSGTFDGQGHTISGVYVNSTKQYTGFFSTVNSGAIVKNLKLTNSYIEGNGSETRSGVGSIAGRSQGTIDTVYSNAVIVNNKQMTGGIVGMVTGAGQNKISNCWFDGTINAINGTGGILGCSYGQTATIEHCLNTGALNVTSGTQVGGLCGYVQGDANVTISDSLNVGTLNAASGVKQIGTIVGAIAKANTLTVSNVYGVTEFSNNLSGYKPEFVTSGSVCEMATLVTYYGNGAANLDYTNYWTAREGMTPVLKSFS